MGKKPMAPMAVSERAKQFMPFKAVAGLDEALERKRIEMGILEENLTKLTKNLQNLKEIQFLLIKNIEISS